MKYSQFLEFNQLLEANKADVDSWKTSDIKLVKEADEYQPAEAEKKADDKPAEKDPDALDTKSSKLDFATKRGRMRKTLNKQAKKLQDGINQEVANKFLKPIKDLKVKVYQKMAEVGKGKQPKDIVAALKGDLENIKKIQDKQMAQIEKYAQSVIDNNTKKINSTIEKKKLKETTVADLQSYWALLTTQIMMNLFQKIAVQDEKVIEEVIKDAGILKAAKQINAALGKANKQKVAKLEQDANTKKEAIKKNDAEADKAAKEGKSEGEPAAAEPEKTETETK
jgi:hypothetical protein